MSSDTQVGSLFVDPPKPSKLDHSPGQVQEPISNSSSAKKVFRYSTGPNELQILPKNETFMQRKLRKMQEEVLQSFAGVDFCKSYSKVEKERLSVNSKDKRKSDIELESPAISKLNKLNTTPENISLSPNVSDTYTLKVDESLLVTPFMARSPSPTSSNNPNSENKVDDVTPEPKTGKNENSSDKNENTPRDESGEKLSCLKANLEVKFKEESFDEMMAKAKKKVPKIAEEKRIARELEEQKKKEQLKLLNNKEMIFKLDTCVFSAKKGSSL